MRVLLYYQKYILSMLWNAAKRYPTEKELKEKLKRKIKKRERKLGLRIVVVIAKIPFIP
jgi:hypothetical protein